MSYIFNLDRFTAIFYTVLVSILLFLGMQGTASAQTVSQQYEQLQSLSDRLEQLQARFAVGINRECLLLTRSLYEGVSDSTAGGEVSRLQEFLRDRGHFDYPEITGYYGSVTTRAVQSWQASNGVVSYGSPWSTGYGLVGPRTRAAIFSNCTSGDVDIPRPTPLPSDDPVVPPDADEPDEPDETPSVSSAFNAREAFAFIASMYDEDLDLLKECPQCTRYWLWSDQLVGQLVLQESGNSSQRSLGRTIERTMNSYDIEMENMWAALDEDYFENARFNGTAETQIGDSVVWYSENNIGGELPCSEYADIAFVKAIYLFKIGDDAAARECYNHGKDFWDGTGMRDAGNITGDYAVYKTALGLLAQELTGYPRIGIPDDYFDRFQAANGGITTDIKNGQPDGSQNIETTAAVLMALDPNIVGDFMRILEGTFRDQIVYEAETDLNHGFGRRVGNGWGANVNQDSVGHVLFGPYASDWIGSSADVTFRMQTSGAPTESTPVVTIDIYDSTANEILAIEEIRFGAFEEVDEYEEFGLGIELRDREDHRFETRVFWHDQADVIVDSVTVEFTE